MRIVAPINSVNVLRVLFAAGADGIYVSGTRFHAREFCQIGLDLTELQALRAECSDVGKEYYLVFNTFPSELDWDDAVEELDRLLVSDPDAVILGSFGLMRWVRENRDVPVIASVLAGTWDSRTARALGRMGVSAVTISRGAVIRPAGGDRPLLKAIAHGNSCSLLDGTCRLGSYLSEIGCRITRQCKPAAVSDHAPVNPCRRPYCDSLHGKTVRFQASPVEFCSLSLLPEWSRAGVRELKINGRTKPEEWIRTVVSVYREAVDELNTSPATWHVRPEWEQRLRELAVGGRMDVMPDPILCGVTA